MSPDNVEELVVRFLERREKGETIAPEEFARAHPACADELLQALGRAQATERFLDALGRAQATERILEDAGWPTKRLGPYSVLELIGSGAMGRVYRAVHDDRPDEELALKLLSPLTLNDAKALARFEREARALTGLAHPGVVRVLDHGTLENVPYLAMDWVRGPSLATALEDARVRRSKDSRRPPSDALSLGSKRIRGHRSVASLVARLSQAVAAVHSSGVLHRDIKPGNVILHEDAQPVLVDFGLARGEETVSLTGTGDLLGTPRYMAPEQARGEETDERTDIHGLGLLLYELLTLEPPHPESDTVSVLRAVAGCPVPAVTRVDPTVPAPLDRIVRRACAFRPAARYGTAAALAQDLEAFLARTSVKARNFSPLERFLDAWTLRRKTLVGVVAALVVLGSLPLLREEPPDFERFISQAALAYEADDMAGTAAAAQRILTHDPEHPEGLFLESLAAGEPRGNRSTFVGLLVEGLVHSRAKVWPEAIAKFEEARGLEPDSPLVEVLLEKTRRKMERQEAAHESRPESASALYESGILHNGQSRFAEAERDLMRAVELDPGHVDAWVQLCIAQFFQDRPEDALESAARGGAWASVAYARTLLLRKNDAGEHVREVLAPVLAEHPQYLECMRVVGFSYDYGHNFAEARRCYESNLDQDPDSWIDLGHLAFLLAGARSASCPDCKSWFRNHPEDLDLEQALELRLQQLDLDRGRTEGRIMRVCEGIRAIGSTQEAEEFIEEILTENGGPTDPARRNRLRKALEFLRR
ncbi:MAG: hypothetical protein CMJ89_01750 [Planctomycetes bacterium]|nr:hypothetical protein [Planctomycetota bacterium]